LISSRVIREADPSLRGTGADLCGDTSPLSETKSKVDVEIKKSWRTFLIGMTQWTDMRFLGSFFILIYKFWTGFSF
jgi:hypothetical protein